MNQKKVLEPPLTLEFQFKTEMNEKIKILYVDDEEPNLYLFKYNFSKYFEVFTANRGSEALEVLNEQHDIKVVISDMKMPLMSGIEFIKKNKRPTVQRNTFF